MLAKASAEAGVTKFSGAALAVQRERRGLTLGEVAKAMQARGTSAEPAQIRDWEIGEHSPSAQRLAVLSDVLGCDVGTFFVTVE